MNGSLLSDRIAARSGNGLRADWAFPIFSTTATTVIKEDVAIEVLDRRIGEQVLNRIDRRVRFQGEF